MNVRRGTYDLRLPSPVQLAQVGEEVVIEDLGELQQRVSVYPAAGEDQIDVVAVTAKLLRHPRHLDALLGHHLPDNMPYMRGLFTHRVAVCDIKMAWIFVLVRLSGFHSHQSDKHPRRGKRLMETALDWYRRLLKADFVEIESQG